jgi:hypothetical protein
MLRPKGEAHDLQKILRGMFSSWEYNVIKGLKITWYSNNRIPEQNYWFGRYIFDKKLIQINSIFDHKKVPRYVIENIIWHEFLHHIDVWHMITAYINQINWHATPFYRDVAAYPKHFKSLKFACAWMDKHKKEGL